MDRERLTGEQIAAGMGRISGWAREGDALPPVLTGRARPPCIFQWEYTQFQVISIFFSNFVTLVCVLRSSEPGVAAPHVKKD